MCKEVGHRAMGMGCPKYREAVKGLHESFLRTNRLMKNRSVIPVTSEESVSTKEDGSKISQNST